MRALLLAFILLSPIARASQPAAGCRAARANIVKYQKKADALKARRAELNAASAGGYNLALDRLLPPWTAAVNYFLACQCNAGQSGRKGGSAPRNSSVPAYCRP